MSRRLLVVVVSSLVAAAGCVSSDGDSAVTTSSSLVPGVQSIVTTKPATTTTVTRPPPTTTMPPVSKAPVDSITLRQDGLGAVSFGESADDVMAVLTELLGPPDWAEIQISADTDLSVRWDDPFLYLQFTDWDHFQAAPEPPVPLPEGLVFHYYLTKSDFLATEAGITAGSTVGELKAAYPDVRFAAGCDETERGFVLDPPEEWLHLPMWGLVEGESVDDDTKIEFIGAGWERSPC